MRWVNKKKVNLMNLITLYLCILFILLSVSFVNFNLLTKVDKLTVNKTKQYDVIHSLLYELSLMINDLDKYSALYTLTEEEIYLKTYQNLIDVYQGNASRYSKIYYIVFTGEKISYNKLITEAINNYDSVFIRDIETILANVDLFISYYDLTVNTSDIKTMLFPSENSNGSDYYNLNLKILSNIQILEYKIRLDNNGFTLKMNSKAKFLNISLYTIITFNSIYLLFLLYKIYVLFIKPIFEGHKLLEELNQENTCRKWEYKYNNQFKDLIDSFNEYVQVNRETYRLIAEQYNKLRIYAEVGEVNYFEYDFDKAEITITYSKKFVEKYQLVNSEIVYSAKEYLKLIHKDDFSMVDNKLRLVLRNAIREFKMEFRIKFPTSQNYCFISCTGQRKTMETEVFIGVQIDITDSKETERLLMEQEKQYRIILENSTDLIAKFDPLGNILFASKSYSNIFKHNQIIGPNEKELQASLKYSNQNWLENVMHSPYTTQEVVLVETDDGEKWISFKNDCILNNKNEVESIISIGHDITELKIVNNKLKYDSEHDSLTGLLNRRGLFNKMAELEYDNLACFFLDINNFKNINDFYGHEVGDIIIKKVADELKIFSERNCIISRLSGDEFVLLAPNYQTNFNLSLIKALLNKILHKNYLINNNNIFVSSSVGFALYPEDTNEFNKLISYADIAMYEAKMTQEKSCVRFTKKMFETINNKVEIANDLKKAIDNDEFTILFQEIVDTITNKISLIEALVRWEHPTKGVIRPHEFISIAEELGLMESLDMLIINKALSKYCEIKKLANYENVKIALNISPVMLLKKDFPTWLLNLVVNLGLFMGDICIEISENTFVNNIEECSVQITKLRNIGFLVALDDFGREFSSLSILDRVEFDIIKIDRLFVKNMHHITNIEIIKMINKIANIKNKIVIAEGVERQEQVEILLELGCFLMQGYYFSLPNKID